MNKDHDVDHFCSHSFFEFAHITESLSYWSWLIWFSVIRMQNIDDSRKNQTNKTHFSWDIQIVIKKSDKIKKNKNKFFIEVNAKLHKIHDKKNCGEKYKRKIRN